MFNSLRTAAAKLTRGSSGGQLAAQDQRTSEQKAEQSSEAASVGEDDTLGSIHSFPPRSSASRDRSRQSSDGRRAIPRASTSGIKVSAHLSP